MSAPDTIRAKLFPQILCLGVVVVGHGSSRNLCPSPGREQRLFSKGIVGISPPAPVDRAMALQSLLFRGDPQLEAAAVSDGAHIVPGATGGHVAKLQRALIELDGASIEKDSKYGPATADAVLAYKRKRSIVNRSRQTQADNIVGTMTMAALDRELLERETSPAGPIRIKAHNAKPAFGSPPQRSTLLLGFKIDVDFPVFPDGNFQRIRLTPRSTGTLEIVNGISGTVRCTNVVPEKGDSTKISFVFDPADPGFVSPTRLNPELRGPRSGSPLRDGGTVRLTRSPFVVQVDAFHPGDAVIDAANASSTNRLVLEVRAPRLAGVVGFAPPTKARPGSSLISSAASEPSPFGRSDGRPVKPKGTGRKINIFGSGETPGFEDYTTDLAFSQFLRGGASEFGSTANSVSRPWTEDPDRTVGIDSRTVSDICLRDSPVLQVTIDAIRRIASSGCRLTFAATGAGARQSIPVLKGAFSGAQIVEEFSDAIVMELP